MCETLSAPRGGKLKRDAINISADIIHRRIFVFADHIINLCPLERRPFFVLECTFFSLTYGIYENDTFLTPKQRTELGSNFGM